MTSVTTKGVARSPAEHQGCLSGMMSPFVHDPSWPHSASPIVINIYEAPPPKTLVLLRSASH